MASGESRFARDSCLSRARAALRVLFPPSGRKSSFATRQPIKWVTPKGVLSHLKRAGDVAKRRLLIAEMSNGSAMTMQQMVAKVLDPQEIALRHPLNVTMAGSRHLAE
jgi:hypothetical protein